MENKYDKYVIHNGVRIHYLIDEDTDNIFVTTEDVEEAFGKGTTVSGFFRTEAADKILAEYKEITGKDFLKFVEFEGKKIHYLIDKERKCLYVDYGDVLDAFSLEQMTIVDFMGTDPGLDSMDKTLKDRL